MGERGEVARTALIILAAGKSTRFDGNKLLTRLNHETLIEHVVGTGLSSKAEAVFLVLGHEAERVEKAVEALKSPKLKLVYNPDYEKGLSYSVKTGIRAAAEWGADAFLILPADVAFVESRDIDSVIERFLETGGRIVVATYKGRHGHPILFSRELLPELLGIKEETLGLKAVVNAHRDEVVEAEAGEFAVRDIDTKADLEECLRRLRLSRDA